MKQLQLQLFGCLLVCPFWPSLTSATLISNVNLVFETFDPVSMVRFFEFNDKGWNISAGCIQDMFYYLDGLHRDISWAMRREYSHSETRCLDTLNTPRGPMTIWNWNYDCDDEELEYVLLFIYFFNAHK